MLKLTEDQIKLPETQIVRCSQCKYWGPEKYDWFGSRPCQNENARFFVAGGDNNDSLYTEPEFGCIDGQLMTNEKQETEPNVRILGDL